MSRILAIRCCTRVDELLLVTEVCACEEGTSGIPCQRLCACEKQGSTGSNLTIRQVARFGDKRERVILPPRLAFLCGHKQWRESECISSGAT